MRGARTTGRSGVAVRRDQGESAGGEQRACGKQRVALLHHLAAPADVRAGLRRHRTATRSLPRSVSSTGATRSAPWGSGAPVMMRSVAPGASRVRRGAGGDRPHHRDACCPRRPRRRRRSRPSPTRRRRERRSKRPNPRRARGRQRRAAASIRRKVSARGARCSAHASAGESIAQCYTSRSFRPLSSPPMPLYEYVCEKCGQSAWKPSSGSPIHRSRIARSAAAICARRSPPPPSSSRGPVGT